GEFREHAQILLHRPQLAVDSAEDLLETIDSQTELDAAHHQTLRERTESVRQILRRNGLQKWEQSVQNVADLDSIAALVL
ncbi:hypothetical protein Q6246_29095, partial [Klebsiella pneumoniae]